MNPKIPAAACVLSGLVVTALVVAGSMSRVLSDLDYNLWDFKNSILIALLPAAVHTKISAAAYTLVCGGVFAFIGSVSSSVIAAQDNGSSAKNRAILPFVCFGLSTILFAASFNLSINVLYTTELQVLTTDKWGPAVPSAIAATVFSFFGAIAAGVQNKYSGHGTGSGYIAV